MTSVTLTIKKHFFEKILNNEKSIEYRKDSMFYKTRFERLPRILRLHYQKKRILEVEILKIERLKTPNHLSMIRTEFCYLIHLKENSAKIV